MRSCLAAPMADHRATRKAALRAMRISGENSPSPHHVRDRATSIFPRSQRYVGVRS